MDLTDILNRHSASKKDNLYGLQPSLTSGNTSAVVKLIESLPLKALFLIRSLHLELTLEQSTAKQTDEYLINHIDSTIGLVTSSSYSNLKYDKNIENGFTHQHKMKGLLDILKWILSQQITIEEFNALYDHWLMSYAIQDLTKAASSSEINEVFTLFLILEEGPYFLLGIVERLEFMLMILNLEYSSRVIAKLRLSSEWEAKADMIFDELDYESKGHLDGENLQVLATALILNEYKTLEPISLRKHTFELMKEMNHSNGLISRRSFKSYLLLKSWTKFSDLESLYVKYLKLSETWKAVRFKILGKKIEELNDCFYLISSSPQIPSIWNQSIILSIEHFYKNSNRKDWDKVHKFLRFSGWALGCTACAATKGECFIQGTYLKDIPEFAMYLMSNFLESEGQFHTSISVSSLNQQSVFRLSGDIRFQVIHRALTLFDKIINAVLYEIAKEFSYTKQIRENNREIVSSAPESLNSTSRMMSDRKGSPIVPRINLKRTKPISVSVRLITPPRSSRPISRNSSTKSARSKSPVIGRIESYDKVMERLKK